jgi:hypothetical protein
MITKARPIVLLYITQVIIPAYPYRGIATQLKRRDGIPPYVPLKVDFPNNRRVMKPALLSD